MMTVNRLYLVQDENQTLKPLGLQSLCKAGNTAYLLTGPRNIVRALRAFTLGVYLRALPFVHFSFVYLITFPRLLLFSAHTDKKLIDYLISQQVIVSDQRS